jgi:hypothetical protein
MSFEVAEFYRLRRRTYVRAVVKMVSAKLRAFNSKQVFSPEELRLGYMMYMQEESLVNTEEFARKFRGDSMRLRRCLNAMLMKKYGPELDRGDERDGDDVADDAAKIVTTPTTPTGWPADATQPFISVYEWHDEATDDGDDVAEALAARMEELMPQYQVYLIAENARLEAAGVVTNAEKVQKRFEKQMAALDKNLPNDRKRMQTLFLEQVEANDGGTGVLLKLIAAKVAQRSTATTTARRAGGGGGGGKSKVEKTKAVYDFFDKGEKGWKDSHAHGLIDVDAVSNDGTTPLMVAALAIDKVSVEYLLKAGADVTKESKSEPTTIAAFLKSKRAHKLLKYDNAGNIVVDDEQLAVMEDGKCDADFGGDDDARIVRLLAGALVISDRKAAAVKKQREDVEKQLQEWDEDDATTTKTKAAAEAEKERRKESKRLLQFGALRKRQKLNNERLRRRRNELLLQRRRRRKKLLWTTRIVPRLQLRRRWRRLKKQRLTLKKWWQSKRPPMLDALRKSALPPNEMLQLRRCGRERKLLP